MIRLTMLLLGAGLLAAGAAVGLSMLQEEGSSPAAPPEPVPITEPIESWYKVLQGEEHIGFYHSYIAPNPILPNTPPGYSVRSRQDMEVRLGEGDDEKYLLFSQEFEGTLDDQFRLISFKAVSDVQGIRHETRLWTEGEIRNAEITFPGIPELRPIQVPVGDLEEASLSLEALLMKLGQDGVLLKEGTLQVPLLLSRDGGKTMAVEVVDLVFYGEKERKYLDRMVPVSRVDIRGYPVDPETPELAGLIPDRFFIDRYGRMVEMVTKGDLRIVLAANDRQAIGDQRRITQDGRRDPFEKDLVMKLKGEEDEGIQRDKILTLDPKKDPASALTRITEVVEAVETLVREKAPERDVERKYGEFLEQFTELHAAATKSGQQGQEMLVQLMGLKQRADEAYPAPLKVFAEASSVFRRFSQAATAGGKIEEMEKLLDELKALLGDPALIGTTVAEDIQKKLIDPAIDLLEKSRNREDLRKKKLVLEGTTESILQIPVSAELGVDLLGQRLSVGRSNVIVVYAETLALINGNPYRVGDIVQDEDVRVEEITRFGVKVSLKQEIRELPLQ